MARQNRTARDGGARSNLYDEITTKIIDELEPEKRGVYAGGIGYFSANGEMDMCIALRTAIIKDAVLYIQAGGGVVADSDPEAEWQETLSKSRALRRAAEDAGLFVRGGGNR